MKKGIDILLPYLNENNDNNLYLDGHYFQVESCNPNELIKKLESNTHNISNIFAGCSSLKYLPDISKWNTTNVFYMSDLFNGCSSLISLPDISGWNVDNVLYMNNLFYECSSLISLPDISKWNLFNSCDKDNLISFLDYLDFFIEEYF